MSIAAKSLRPEAPSVPAAAAAVVDFWRDAGPDRWFAKDPEFDRRFRDRFLVVFEAAAAGDLSSWSATAEGALALAILLDQYPRNAFRGTRRMYATDAQARAVADAALRASYLDRAHPDLAVFLILPFGHSEDLADQDRAVALAERLGEPAVSRAKHYRDIIRRFGRFPHRNPVLGREMTEGEAAYLADGGYQG